MLFGTGDQVKIRLGPAEVVGHITEAEQYKSAWIVSYSSIPSKKLCIASVFPGVTNIPEIDGWPRDIGLFQGTAWMYYTDPQDKKRTHIWPCPVSASHGVFDLTANVYEIAKRRIDHVIQLTEYQNALLTVVPGTDAEFELHKQWFRIGA